MEFAIILPALVAGFAVLLSHIPLGREVLARGIIFIDLAVAQFAGLGIIVAGSFGLETYGIAIQLCALSGALVGACLLNVTEKWLKHHQEAGIGCLFILAATASLLLLANNPHGGEHLRSILIGQILWVEWSQIVPAMVIGIIILGLYWFQKKVFKTAFFYVLFAIAITQSVQLVGVYLVFATLIIPALTLIKHKRSTALLGALMLGTTSYALGLVLSSLVDLPSGAVIVWTMALLGLLTALGCRALPAKH